MGLATVFQTQQIDLIQTRMMIGYGNGTYVGHKAFPLVPVDQESFLYERFDDDAVTLLDTKRKPGENIKRFSSDFGNQRVELWQDAIEYELPYEYIRTSRVHGIELDARAGRRSRGVIDLINEYDRLNLLANPTNYPATNRVLLAGATQLSNPASDIETIFDTAKNAVYDQTGEFPNVCIMSNNAVQAVRKHPRTKEGFLNYASSNNPLVQLEGIAARYALGQLYVSTAGFRPQGAPLTQSRSKMFPNAIWMGYVPSVAANPQQGDIQVGQEVMPNPNHDQAMPSFGYDFGLEGETLVALEPYDWKNNRTYYYPTISRRRPVITSSISGYLISNVAA